MIFDFGLSEEMKKNSEFYYIFQAWDKQIKANYDSRFKNIGDRVVIWCSSGSCDMHGHLYYESEEFFKQEFIVIENEINYNISVPYLNTIQHLDLDLILYSPSYKKNVRSNSEFCRIIDNKKNV